MQKIIDFTENNRFITTLLTGLAVLFLFLLIPTDWDNDESQDNLIEANVRNIDYDNYFRFLTNENGDTLLERFGEGAPGDEYIRKCGNDLEKRYWLEVESDGDVINSKEDLVDFIDGVDTLEEAIALLYATDCNYLPRFENAYQVASLVEGVIEVQIFYYPEYTEGCGNKATQLVIYNISRDGELDIVQNFVLEEPEYKCPEEVREPISYPNNN